jgi:hypothetical protein
MYRISKNTRNFSPTPIVKVIVDEQGKEHEEIVMCAVNMKKADGDILNAKVVELLNNSSIKNVEIQNLINKVNELEKDIIIDIVKQINKKS